MGITHANWYRHWGVDADNACSTYSADGTVAYFGKEVRFRYGGVGPPRGQFNGDAADPEIALWDQVHVRESHSFSSPPMTYVDSGGNMITAAAGAIAISFDRSGIDALNTTINHELEHLHIAVRWADGGEWRTQFGPRVTDDGDGILEPHENDFDGDFLPNQIEDAAPGLRWDDPVTHEGFYVNGTDEEVWCEQAALFAPPGNYQADWAFEGKQSTPSN
jgi:hypothetical protein